MRSQIPSNVMDIGREIHALINFAPKPEKLLKNEKNHKQ